MRCRTSRLLLGLILWGAPAIAGEDIRFPSDAIANMSFGDGQFGIFPMTSNSTIPAENWQFRYYPLLQPEYDSGQLRVAAQQHNSSHYVCLSLRLDSQLARDKAFAAVLASIPQDKREEGGRIQRANVHRFDIPSVRVEVPLPTGKTWIASLSPDTNDTLPLVLPARSREEAESFVEWLRSPAGLIQCTYLINTRKVTRNVQQVKMSDLRQSDAFKRLENLPEDQGKVYVHRDQIQKIAEEARRSCETVNYLENPEKFDANVFASLINQWQETIEVDAARWGEFAQRSLLDAPDLAPDVIQRQLEKTFVYDDSKQEYRISEDSHLGAIGNVNYGGFGAGGGMDKSKSYSKEELSSRLRADEHEVSFEGKKIIPKKIRLHVVHKGRIQDQLSVASVTFFDQGADAVRRTREIRPGGPSIEPRVMMSLAGRLAELENQHLPERLAEVENQGLPQQARRLARQLTEIQEGLAKMQNLAATKAELLPISAYVNDLKEVVHVQHFPTRGYNNIIVWAGTYYYAFLDGGLVKYGNASSLDGVLHKR